MQAEQHAQQRRFAGTVMADQAEDLAILQGEGDILQHLPPAEAGGKAGGLDCGRGHAASCGRSPK